MDRVSSIDAKLCQCNSNYSHTMTLAQMMEELFYSGLLIIMLAKGAKLEE
jgi:hypothetical protein